MKFIRHSKSRAVYGLAAVFLFAATAVSFLAPRYASAAQVTSRSIQMSSSTQGATNTTYKVQFTVPTTGNIEGIVIDFCDNSPLIGDTTCTLPTGFSLTASPAVSNFQNLSGTWTAVSENTNRTLTVTNATGPSVTAATVVGFDITTVTNPTTDNHTFYARIMTYADSAVADAYTVAAPGAYVDYGGIALSTGKVINITARVMESLAFCVYDATCGDDPSMTLGHGANMILDTTAVDTDTASFSISTNAQSGAIVNIKGDTLKSGSNDINAAGATAVAFAAGTENFGTRVSTSGTNIAAAAPYNGAANNYGFDTANTTSTYGDLIATLSGPVNSSVSTLTYGATASNTTAAGIYTTAHQLIATGTF